jgi:sigma-B regulation protein RsbU (phosphoserine phosphatase)
LNPIDTSSSLRIAVIMEMLEEVSRATDPEAAFRAYARRIRRVRPLDAYALITTSGLKPGEYKVTRWYRSETLGGAGLSALNPTLEWDRLPIHSGTSGFAGKVVQGQSREPRLYQDLKLGADPALGDLLIGMGSCMAVPIFENGRIAHWSLMFRADPKGYSREDLEDELLIGNLLGAMTQNLASMARISALNAELKGQFDEVGRVQRGLLPDCPPSVPGLTFAASSLPSGVGGGGGGAGGDSYDFFDLGPGRVGVLIADVSGHGPAAATVMAMLHAALHARPEVCVSPALGLRFANAQLAASSIEGGHVTGLLLAINAAERTITIARAGHPRPRLRRASGQVEEIGDAGAPPMGIIAEGYAPTETVVELRPGDAVILYTDGITEAESPGGEQFGVAGLDRIIANAGPDPARIIEEIRAALAAHTDNALREDDQTLVVIGVG